MRKEFYTYTVSFLTGIAAASQDTRNITIDKDANFEFIEGAVAAQTDAADIDIVDIAMGQQFPGLRVWVYDSGRGAYITDKPIAVVNMFGNGQYPGILAEPLLILAGSSLGVTVFNDYPVDAIEFLQLSFIGRKVSLR